MNINQISDYIFSLRELPLYKIYLNLIQIYDIDIVKFVLYDKYGFEPNEPNIESIQDQINRIGQEEFRSKLIQRYKRCIVTQDCADICEACHIVPYSICKSYDINNGLLLTASLHKLFDNYDMTIDATTHLIKMKNKQHSYSKYDKMYVHNLSKDTSEYLAIHNKLYGEN